MGVITLTLTTDLAAHISLGAGAIFIAGFTLSISVAVTARIRLRAGRALPRRPAKTASAGNRNRALAKIG